MSDSEGMAACKPAKHVALAPIDWLLGKWKTTSAKAFYPTIKTLVYNDEMQYSHEGEAALVYSSSARHGENGKIMHMESGYLRIHPETKQLALLVGHSVGVTELSEGEVNGQKITLESRQLHCMSFMEGNHPTKVVRCLELVDENTLKIVVSMGTSEQPLQEHLHVTYKRCE